VFGLKHILGVHARACVRVYVGLNCAFALAGGGVEHMPTLICMGAPICRWVEASGRAFAAAASAVVTRASR